MGGIAIIVGVVARLHRRPRPHRAAEVRAHGRDADVPRRRARGRRLRRRLPRRSARAATSVSASAGRRVASCSSRAGFALLALRLGRRLDRDLVHAGPRLRPRHVAVVRVGRRRRVRDSNGVNITDGMDGLAAGSATLVFLAFTVICFWQFRHPVIYGVEAGVRERPRRRLERVRRRMRAASSGGTRHRRASSWGIPGHSRSAARWPASRCSRHVILLLPVLGGLYVVETLSVIAQVVSFRGFGRRVLRMAPIHHHFEVIGWPEFTVIVRFWIFAGACVALGDRPLLRRLHQHPRSARLMAADPRRRARGDGRSGRAASPRAGRRRHGRGGLSRGTEGWDERSAGARALGIEVVESPDAEHVAALAAAADLVVPSPGVPERHPAIAAARRHDVARALGDRPRGRDRVERRPSDDRRRHRDERQDHRHRRSRPTSCRPRVSRRSRRATSAVRCSTPSRTTSTSWSPRCPRSSSRSPSEFAPHAAALLNLGADHLDWHRTFDAYARAKANVFVRQGADDVLVFNADDPVVAGVAAEAPGRSVAVLDRRRRRTRAPGRRDGRRARPGRARRRGAGARRRPAQRRRPVDLANALAASALARRGRRGSTPPPGAALVDFDGLPHRMELVAEHDGVRWIDDSKATNVHAAIAAVRGLEGVVLLAGGRNKGTRPVGAAGADAPQLRAVVAIGDAAARSRTPSQEPSRSSRAGSMRRRGAQRLRARPGAATPSCSARGVRRSTGTRRTPRAATTSPPRCDRSWGCG